MIKKISLILVSLISLFSNVKTSMSYYMTSTIIENNFKSKSYSIDFDNNIDLDYPQSCLDVIGNTVIFGLSCII